MYTDIIGNLRSPSVCKAVGLEKKREQIEGNILYNLYLYINISMISHPQIHWPFALPPSLPNQLKPPLP